MSGPYIRLMSGTNAEHGIEPFLCIIERGLS